MPKQQPSLLHKLKHRLKNLGAAISVSRQNSGTLTPTPEWALERIKEAKEKKLLFLNLRKGGEQTPLIEIPNDVFELTELRMLDLTGNKLTSLPESLKEMQNLKTLDLRSNQLISLPWSMAELRNLTTLGLSRNQLASLPDFISQLENLTVLDLSMNKLLSLPESITKLRNLKTLGLDGNRLATPPQEVAEKGLESIREYFRQLEAQGQDRLYEAKLLILGEAGAGKTTLAKKIEDINYELKDEKTTQGIDVYPWSFPMEGDRNFRVNIWDFGGQEIYHATHQFFLTKRSLYALVADTRKEDTDFYYWLNVVSLLSENSPLLIIKNEKQDRHREINERQLRGQFEGLKEVLATNLATNRGVDKMVEEIKHYIRNLPHIGSPLPKAWVRVRESLERDTHNYISLEKYLSICKDNGFIKAKDSFQLSSYLHDIGVILHFQDDPLLRKIVILKPKWGTDAVYKVVDNKTVIKNLGRFTYADLNHIWNAPEHEDMHDELLQLMMKFRLCYEIPTQKGTYIAPQLLTENQPEYEWNEQNNLLMRYSYEFMPKRILLQFIVVMSEDIWKQNVWRSGIVIEKGKTRAEVIEFYETRQIRVRVTGPHKKELMTIVMYELDKIHHTYKRLKYDKLIPCNCAECKKKKAPYFYRYETLQKFLEDRQSQIQCQESYKMVNVYGLIDEIISGITVAALRGNEDSMVADQLRRIGINIGDNFSGTFIVGSLVENSLNRIESASISNELKSTLKQLVLAVDTMNKYLPERMASEVADDLGKLVDEATRPLPNKKWYSVSVDGLTKAAENLGKIGEPVIELSQKVLSLLTMGVTK